MAGVVLEAYILFEAYSTRNRPLDAIRDVELHDLCGVLGETVAALFQRLYALTLVPKDLRVDTLMGAAVHDDFPIDGSIMVEGDFPCYPIHLGHDVVRIAVVLL